LGGWEGKVTLSDDFNAPMEAGLFSSTIKPDT
jgi:hypothetical protein